MLGFKSMFVAGHPRSSFEPSHNSRMRGHVGLWTRVKIHDIDDLPLLTGAARLKTAATPFFQLRPSAPS